MDDEEKIAKIYHLLKDTPMEYILENPLLLKIEKVIDEDKTEQVKIEDTQRQIDELLREMKESLDNVQSSYGTTAKMHQVRLTFSHVIRDLEKMKKTLES